MPLPRVVCAPPLLGTFDTPAAALPNFLGVGFDVVDGSWTNVVLVVLFIKIVKLGGSIAGGSDIDIELDLHDSAVKVNIPSFTSRA